jgi:hypothetical protein
MFNLYIFILYFKNIKTMSKLYPLKTKTKTIKRYDRNKKN